MEMSRNLWKPLEAGDLVDIVAPGMKPQPGVLENTKNFVESWGLQARIPRELIGKDLVCSNSKRYRLDSMKKALQAKDSKMVWCLRGGYGSLHLLDGLGKMENPGPKAFMGLSDITSLHSFLVQEWGWATVHGNNIDRFVKGEASASEEKVFKNLLFGKISEVSYSLKALNEKALIDKKIKSSVIGGNMITLQSSFGTSFEIQCKNKIVFFEDIGERAYRIDRVLEHMKQLGLFKGVKAVVFGQFTGGLEPDGRDLVPRLLKSWAGAQSFPVLSGLPSGHDKKKQRPLPLGTRSLLQLGRRPFLNIHSGVKS